MIHDLAYGLAYGSNFAGAFANEFVSDNVREALASGAVARKAAGANACEKAADAIRPDVDGEPVVQAIVVNP